LTVPKVKTTYISGDRWYVMDDDSQRAVGVSAVKDMMPKQALTGWAAKQAAFFCVDNLETIRLLVQTDENAAIDLIKGAPWRKSGKAAGAGTEIHGETEQIAVAVMQGTKPRFRPGANSMPFLRHYVRFLTEFKVKPVMLETTVWNEDPPYAGTFDLLCYLQEANDPEPVLSIVDTKTGASGVWSDAALQQTAYRYASHYIDPDTGELRKMPWAERTYGLWLRPNGFALLPLASELAEWEQFKRLHGSFEWKRTRDKKVVGKAVNRTPIKRAWNPNKNAR
jgi:hypothetical protein